MKKLTTQKVTAELNAAGFEGSKHTRRIRKDGYRVYKINNCAVAVEAKFPASDGSYMEESKKYQQILEAAGLRVERPFNDKAVLGVARK